MLTSYGYDSFCVQYWWWCAENSCLRFCFDKLCLTQMANVLLFFSRTWSWTENLNTKKRNSQENVTYKRLWIKIHRFFLVSVVFRLYFILTQLDYSMSVCCLFKISNKPATTNVISIRIQYVSFAGLSSQYSMAWLNTVCHLCIEQSIDLLAQYHI